MIHHLAEHLVDHWTAVVGDRWRRPRRIDWMKFGSVTDFPRDYVYLYAFLDGGSEPALVVKITADRASQARLVREFDLVGRIRARVSPEVAASIPAPLAGLPFGDYWIGVEECAGGERFVPTVDLARRGERRRVTSFVEQVRDWLVEFARSGRLVCELDSDLWARCIASPLARLRSFYSLEPHEERYLAILAGRLEARRGTDVSTIALHGDLWPGNIFETRGGLRVIDWTGFRERDISYHDVFGFLDSFVLEDADTPAAGERRSLLMPPIDRTWLHELAAGFIDDVVPPLGLERDFVRLMLPMYYVTMAARRDPVNEASVAVNHKFRALLGRYIRLATVDEDFDVPGPWSPGTLEPESPDGDTQDPADRHSGFAVP